MFVSKAMDLSMLFFFYLGLRGCVRFTQPQLKMYTQGLYLCSVFSSEVSEYVHSIMAVHAEWLQFALLLSLTFHLNNLVIALR